MSRIVLFGATGYTGALTARAMLASGMRPLLAGRSGERVGRLARELGGLEHRRADVEDPSSVRALLEAGDVLVSTVGPFGRFGAPAVQAAVDAGAHYLDSTGEPAFIRRVHDRWGPMAARAGVGLLTAFGADWIPGNLAGALALREAGEAARSVSIGYFTLGGSNVPASSGGTRASTAAAMLEPGFAFRDGELRPERTAARLRTFDVRGRSRPAVSVAGSEHLFLPRIAPALREVDCYLGWFGSLSRPLQAVSAATELITRLPPAREALRAAAHRLVRGSSGGPSGPKRAATRQHVVAIACGAAGEALATVHLEGANPYGFTAEMLAWGARQASAGNLRGTGALGPVDGLGLEALREGCVAASLVRV